jgi:hypothetical protein
VDVLVRIKRLVVARWVEFTAKAIEERLSDGLKVEDVLESVVNANAVKKVLRSRSTSRSQRRELLYVIESRASPASGSTLRARFAERTTRRFLCLRLVEDRRVKRRRGRAPPAGAAASLESSKTSSCASGRST